MDYRIIYDFKLPVRFILWHFSKTFYHLPDKLRHKFSKSDSLKLEYHKTFFIQFIEKKEKNDIIKAKNGLDVVLLERW